MKLRLPHKFQAALMAALASVSFTTLSTGTLTVAAGAALLAGQQAQAADEELTTFTTTNYNAGTVNNFNAKGFIITLNGPRLTTTPTNTYDLVYLDSITLASLRGVPSGSSVTLALADANGKVLSLSDNAISSTGQAKWEFSNTTVATDSPLYFYWLDTSKGIVAGNTLTSSDMANWSNAGCGSSGVSNYNNTENLTSCGFLDSLSHVQDTQYAPKLTIVTSGPVPQAEYTWKATDTLANWDEETLNWTLRGEDSTYTSGVDTIVNFNDGAFAKEVTVVGAIKAGTVNVNASYKFTVGSGDSLSVGKLSVASGATATVANEGELSLAKVTGAGALEVGGGTVNLSAGNDFSGGLTVSGGVVHATQVSALGTGTLTATGTGVIEIENTNPGNLTVAGDGTLRLITTYAATSQQSNVELGNIQAANLSLAADEHHSSRFRNQNNPGLSGVGHLYFDGGQFWVSNAFTYDGAVTFNETVYKEARTSSDNKLNDAALRVNANVTLTGKVDVAHNTRFTWQASNLAVEFGGVVVGSGNLELAIYSGSNNTFRIGGDASAYAGSITSASGVALDITSGGKLSIGSSSNLAGAVSLAGQLNVNGGATISGALSGAGTLAKVGTGTFTLSNNYTGFTGNVGVQEGTLALGSTGEHTLNQMTLAGGELSIGSGLIVTPTAGVSVTGDSTLTVDGTLKLSSTSPLQVNNAALTLAGSGTIDLGDMELKDGESYKIKGDPTVRDPYNGFTVTSGYVEFATLTGTASITGGTQLKFTRDGGEGAIDPENTTHAKFAGNANYGTFSITLGTETLSEIREWSKAGGETPQVQNIELSGGAQLNVDESMAASMLAPVSGATKGTVNITSTGTFTSDGDARNITITGAGTYALTKRTASGNWFNAPMVDTLAPEWTGTVKLADMTKLGNLNLNNYGNEHSTVMLDNVTAYLNTTPFTTKLLLGSGGFTVVDGGSSATYTFAGGVGGEGNFNINYTASPSGMSFVFSGDVKDWTGSLVYNVNKENKVVFKGGATEVNATITRSQGTMNMEVGDDTAFTTTFKKAVGASSLTVKAQTNATFMETVTMGGDINLNGNSTATFEKAVSAANLRLGDNSSPYTGATATFNGTLTLTGDLTVNGTTAVPSSARLNAGGSVGVIDLSHGGNAHGTVTVATGKTLTYGGSFWGANNNRLILEEGATVKLANNAPIEILGQAGGGYVSSNANVQFGVNASAYTLHNVQATVNEDNDNVQLHFSDSKFVTTHTVTLKNLQSVFSGMDIQDGTTTVGSGVAADTTVQLGEVTLSGGNLTLAEHVIGSVNGIDVTDSGTVTGGKLVMGDIITMGADATLTLSDNMVVDVSALTPEPGSRTDYVDGDNAGNGFASMVASVRLVDFTDGGTVAPGTGVTYVSGSNHGTLVLDGDNKGLVEFNETSYSALYVNMPNTTEMLVNAQEKAISKGAALTEVYLNAGTLDTTDAEMLFGTLHVNSGEGTVYVTGDTASITSLDGKGTLSVGPGTNLNGTNLNIAAGDTLTLTGGATITYNNISNQGTLGIGENTRLSTGAITVSGDTFTTTGAGTLVSSGKLTVDGGTVNLGSNAQFSAIDLGNGTLNITAGTTTVSGDVKLGYDDGKASGTLNVAQGATLTAQNVSSPWGYSSMTVAGTINATGQFAITTGAQVRNVSGSGTINTGRLVVGNVTTKAVFSGGLKINIGDGGITGSNGVRPLELHDVTVGVYGDSDGWAAANAITLADTTTGTTFNIGTGKAVTLNGAVSGSGKLVKEGAGNLELTSVNSYGGAIAVNEGELLITTNSLPNTLTVTGEGELHMRSAQGTDSQNVDLKTVNATNLHLVADAGHNSRFNYISNSGSSSNLNGVQNLYFDGGQLWLNGKDMTDDNKFTGNVTFNTTTYSENNAFGGAAIRVNTNGTFSGAVNVAEDTKIAWGANKTVEFSGTVTGDGDLNLASYNNNTGTFKVSGTATGYTGAITSDSHITLNVANGGSLNLAAGSNLAGAVAVDGTMSVTGDSTISGAVSGSGTINVNAGTLELTGASTFAGTTNVKQGTLVLGNAYTTNTITVASGATLSLLEANALTATGALTFESGARLDLSGFRGAVSTTPVTVATAGSISGFGDGMYTAPTAPKGMQATVTLGGEGNNEIQLSYSAKEDATMHLYILTGQSNSLGAVKGTPLPAGMLAAYQSEGLLWNGNMHKDRPSGADTNRFIENPDWQVVAPQEPGLTINPGGYANNPCMGPEYGFSYIMESKDWAAQWLGKDGTVGVVKGSLDGGGNGYWLQDNNAYQTLLDNVKLSIQDAVDMGYSNISLDGLMYLQGESNSAAEANLAGERFTGLLGYLKTDLQSWLTESGLKGVTLSFDSNAVTGEPATWTANNIEAPDAASSVTANQFIELATEDGMINADKNGYGFVYTRDLAKITSGDSSNVHYRGTAQLTIGARYAYAFAVQNGVNVGAVRGQDDSATLDTGAAWWMETAPTAADVAVWDISSVSQSIPVPECNRIADGQTLTVGGIRIEDVYSPDATVPGTGSVAITGGTLEIGNAALEGSGITLVGGDLSISSAVSAVANQTWQAENGHKLAVNGTTTIATDAKLTLADGLYLTFGAITGTGNLEIGTVTFDMDLDYMMANGLGRYISSAGEGDNGFFTGNLDLVKLTGDASAIIFTHGGGVENITKAGDLANYTLQLSDDSKKLSVSGLDPDENTYFTRKGEVTYTNTDTDQYGIYTADRVLLSGSVENPATLKLESALREGTTIQAAGLGGTVNIAKSVSLAAASVNAAGGPVAITGSGKFVGKTSGTVGSVTAVDAFGAGVTLSDEWTGTVRIANTTINGGQTGIKLNELGNENSVVEFEGVKAFLNASPTTYTPNIRLTGEGLEIDAGSTDGTYTFNGDVTGSGTLKLSLSRGSDRHTYVFAGDVAGWNGELLAPSNKTLTVKFTGEADTVNAAIKKTGGTLNLVADAATTFKAALTGLNSFTVNGSKSASVLGGIGTNATTLNDGSSLTIGGEQNSSLGTVTLNNNTALTIGGSGTVTASNVKVGDQCAATITLSNDFSMEQLDTIAALNTLTIASEDGMTKTLTTGQLGFDNVSTVISLQNVNMVVTGAATAGVLDAHNNNKGTMTVGANANLDLRGTTQWNTSDTKYVDLVVKDGGAVSVSGGTENKIRGVNLGAGSSLTFGAGTTTTIGGDVVLANTITNYGTLIIAHDITATGLAEASEQYRVGADDEKSTNGNYFYQGQRTEGTLTVVTGGGTVNPGGHKVTQGGHVYTLKDDGTATGVTADGVDYSTFYQGEAGSTVSVSQIAATAAKHNANLLGVYSLGAYDSPTVLNVDRNLANALVAFSTVNIASGVEYTGDLLIFGGENTVSGQIDIARLGFYGGNASVTTFTDAPVVDSGVRFSSDAGMGGVQVQANPRSSGTAGYYEYYIGDANYSVAASELSKEGEGPANVANSLMVQRVHNSEASSTGKLTLSAGAFNMSLKEVIATSGDVEFLNMTAANATTEGKQTSVSLNKLEIGAGKTVSFYEATAPTSVGDMVKECAVTVTDTLTVGDGAHLNADLNMASGSTLDVSADGGIQGLIMGSKVTLNSGSTLKVDGIDANEFLRDYFGGSTTKLYTLYSGSEKDPLELYIGGQKMDAITFDAWNKPFMDASSIYSNLQEKTYYLVYNPNHNNVGMVAIGFVPEPTTSTLSLLALCALAARRRRK